MLLQNSGSVVDWIMKKGQYQSGNAITNCATGWQAVSTGDFDGNGSSDVLFQNGGIVVDWTMKNGEYAGRNVITIETAG